MKPFASKNLALAGLTLAGVMGIAPSTFAYTPVGTFSAGPGIIDFSTFTPITCTSTLTISVPGGPTASVTNATFAAPSSPLCPFITFTGPWTIGAATLVGTNVYQATISNVGFTVKQANGTIIETCKGSVTARLDQNFMPRRLTFTGTLVSTAPVTGQPCPFKTGLNSYLPTSLTAP